MVPMDFSIQASAALDWTLKIMRATDYLVVLNVLNLKAPSTFYCLIIIPSLCT